MEYSISQIKEIFKNTPLSEIVNITDKFKNDKRKGVLDLVKSYTNKYNKYNDEIQRIKNMCVFENKYYDEGAEYIAGIDEVGRGPLAGPVVTAAVILPKGCFIMGINDSKKLSSKKREELFCEIKQKAVSVNISLISNNVIDDVNILQATLLSMQKTIEGLSVKPQIILVDAVKIPYIDIPQESIIRGDEKSISIAAASIIAKVTRDELMVDFAKVYPQYSFDKNKGYGSAEHIAAIKKYGLCPIHRLSFTHNFV